MNFLITAHGFTTTLDSSCAGGCSYADATCMVTVGEGKCYSLGLDLEWLPGLEPAEALEFGNNNQKLMARLLSFPLVTVAALNG